MLDFDAAGISQMCTSLKYAETLERWDMDNGELMFKPGQLDESRTRFIMTVVLMNQRLLLIALGVKRIEKVNSK